MTTAKETLILDSQRNPYNEEKNKSRNITFVVTHNPRDYVLDITKQYLPIQHQSSNY